MCSMLSAQVDRLRKAAQTYRTLGNHELEQLLLDAADTISELRDMAQQAQSENAKLRELVEDMFRDFANADYELKRSHGRTFMAATRYEPRMRELGVEVG